MTKLLTDTILEDDYRPAYIYALCDPRDGALRYIGKSVNPAARQAEHCLQATSLVSWFWKRSLYEVGLNPVMIVIDDCKKSECRERERFWVKYYSHIYPLLNTDHVPSEVRAKKSGRGSLMTYVRLPESRSSSVKRQIKEGHELYFEHIRRWYSVVEGKAVIVLNDQQAEALRSLLECVIANACGDATHEAILQQLKN